MVCCTQISSVDCHDSIFFYFQKKKSAFINILGLYSECNIIKNLMFYWYIKYIILEGEGLLRHWYGIKSGLFCAVVDKPFVPDVLNFNVWSFKIFFKADFTDKVNCLITSTLTKCKTTFIIAENDWEIAPNCRDMLKILDEFSPRQIRVCWGMYFADICPV